MLELQRVHCLLPTPRGCRWGQGSPRSVSEARVPGRRWYVRTPRLLVFQLVGGRDSLSGSEDGPV